MPALPPPRLPHMPRLLCLLAAAASALAVFAPDAARAQASPWQQRVAYEMDVTLLADRHQMRGTQRLTYTNHSPDTLRTAYYHLYFNAFHPQSMMAERNRHLPDPDGRIVPRIFDLGPDEVGYHRILALEQDGTPVDFEVTDTVLRVDLAAPILPGATTVFTLRFRSQVPLQTRRSGRDNREGIDYSMSQWYPKLAEYDERGWHADPYVGREFYAPYGTFDVRITLPAAYTLGSTGVLQNPDAVGHGYAARGNATWRPDDGEYAPTDSLTWHFRAEDVHDFCWAADPDYIHQQLDTGDGRLYHLLYEPDVEARWQQMPRWLPAIVRFYDTTFGRYPYPQFTVAQAGDGGMEYPMITLITGERAPGSLLGVTAHETAHEWFQTSLGSNEADYAWMDEGFASYATAEAVAYVAQQGAPTHRRSYLSHLVAHNLGVAERPSTPADWFQTNTGYGIAAYSTGAMLVEMLGYVLSDDVRDRWLKRYVAEHRLRHPDPFDMERAAEAASGLRLDWYFEQWTNTTHRLDYSLEDLEQTRAADGTVTATMELEREAEAVMPVDVRLTLEDGTTRWVTVPLGLMQGHKPVPDAGWTVAAPWLWTFPTYDLTVAGLPARVVRAEIDPEGRTPDANRLNNTSGFPLTSRFLRAPQQDWFRYDVGYRPLLGFAHDFGVGAGVQARGTYLFGDHTARAMLTLWPELLASDGPALTDAPDERVLNDASFFDGIDYELRYEAPVRALGPGATLEASAVKHLGLMEHALTFQRALTPFGASFERTLSVAVYHQLNPSARVFGRSTETSEVRSSGGVLQGTVTEVVNPFQEASVLGARVRLDVRDGSDRLALMLETGSALSEVGPLLSASPGLFDGGSASRLHVSATKTLDLGPLTGRADMQVGLGARDLLLYKNFQLGSRSAEAQWRDDAFRTTAAAFARPYDDARLMAFSAAGPVAYRNDEGLAPAAFTGRNLVAGRLSVGLQPFGRQLARVRALRSFRLEAFSGLGQTWSDGAFLAGFAADDLLADAGLGAAFDLSDVPQLRRWTAQSDVLQGLHVVARFPFWVSDPGVLSENDEVAFRWRLGLQKDL